MITAIPMLLLMVAVEGAVHLPTLAWLDSYAPQDLANAHLTHWNPVLCGFPLISISAYRISIKRFKVDL